MKKYVFNGVFVICLLIILSNAFTFITGGFHKYNMSTFGFQFSRVVSESMVPTLNVGDIQLCKKTNFNNVKVGDIILYYHDGKVIIHRVKEKIDNKDNKYLVMKGDNNPSCDPWYVYPDDIISKVLINKI